MKRSTLLLVLGLTALAAHAQAPSLVSYQGVIEENGTPINDPSATLTFRLFDAATGGSPLWSETQSGIDIEEGIFSVVLGSVTPLSDPDLTFNQSLWLEVEEGASGTTLSPRTQLTATPYSMGLVLPQVHDAAVGGTALAINNTGSGDGIRGETQATAGRGLVGQASAFTGPGYGVYGLSQSAAGVGVYGLANSSVSGNANYGVFGKTNSTSGYGVYGEHTSGQFGYLGGGTYGARGEHALGSYGLLGGSFYGTFGRHPNANRGYLGHENYGVWGKHEASGNVGSLGALATGVRGENGNGNIGELAHAAYGVSGYATNGIAGRFSTLGTTNPNTVVSIAGNSATTDLISASIGGQAQFEVDGDGAVRIFELGEERIRLDNDEGGNAPSIKLFRGGVTVLELDAEHNGDSRVITQELEITGGADLAEHFDVTAASSLAAPEVGMVVSIDPTAPGRLVVSDAAYDPLVAGVISGAGGVETGLLLRQEGSVADGEVPVALVGRVFVRADAAHGAIRPGDLLTTSPTPGHAMRAADRERAFGTTLGKALTGLDAGTGLVLVLVNLQ